MENNEVKKVMEYCWGSIITVIKGDIQEIIIMARAKYLARAIVFMLLFAALIGYLIGKI